MTLEIGAKMASIAGLRTQGERVAKAATEINNAFAAAQNAAQNAQAADSVAISDRAAVVPAVEDAVRGAVLSDGDVTRPIVDLLQSVQAYKANAAALRVTADVERVVMDIVGKK